MSNKFGSSTGARLLKPAPEELRQMVLDYLVHNCYANAARAFVRESDMIYADVDRDEVMDSPEKQNSFVALDESLALGESRKEIRMHVLTGRVDEATALLNKNFPSVLSDTSEDVIRPNATSGKLEYLPSASVDPTHLALNIRIQAFIEATRTKALLYCPPGSTTPLPHPPLLSGSSSTSSDDEDAEMTDDTEATNEQLLHRAHDLYSEANQLTRPTDRATYIHELAHVVGILAYKVPEQSPLAMYMTQERRESVANQIDGAILYRAKRATISRIELYTRYTSTLWGILHQRNCKVPPRSTWPVGVSLPPAPGRAQENLSVLTKDSDSLENAVPTAKKQIPDKETDEVLPPFDLRLFLESEGCR